MGWLSSAWEGVTSAASTVKNAVSTVTDAVSSGASYVWSGVTFPFSWAKSNPGKLARFTFLFVPTVLTMVLRELGWDRLFTYETACEIDSLSCADAYCEPSTFLQENIEYMVYGLWAISLSFMLATHMKPIAEGVGLIKKDGSDDERQPLLGTDGINVLTGSKKILFYFLVTAGFTDLGVRILKTYMGQRYELQSGYGLSEDSAAGASAVTTAYWLLCTLLVKMPYFLKNTRKCVEERNSKPISEKPIIFTLKILTSGANGIIAADFIERFIESYDIPQNNPGCVILMIMCGGLSFISTYFISAASFDDLSLLKDVVAKHPIKGGLFCVAALLDGSVWLPLNTNQIGGRIQQWTSDALPVASNSTSFFNICHAQQLSRTDPIISKMAIDASTFIFFAFPATAGMALFMIVLGLKKELTEEKKCTNLLIH